MGNNLVEILAPAGLEFTSKDFLWGEQHARVYAIIDYPPRVKEAWISKFTRMPGVVCSFHCVPTNSFDLIKDINRAISEMGFKLSVNQSALLQQRTEQQYKDAHLLLKKIDQEQQSVFFFVALLMVIANDKKDMDLRCKKLEAALAGQGLRGRTIMFLQEEAARSLSPFGILNKSISENSSRNMPAETVAAAFPFVSSGINDNSGILLGHDYNGGVVLTDMWLRGSDRTNANWIVLGKPGVGKSTAVKKILCGEYAQGTKIVVLDPEREYTSMASYFGGNIIDCGGGSRGIINPLQVKSVPLDDNEDESKLQALRMHFKTLRTFFSLYAKGLDAIDFDYLEIVLEELYSSFGINWDTDPDKIHNEKWPTLQNLYDLLVQKAEKEIEKYEKIAMVIRKITIGADGNLWNGFTSLQPDSDFVVLDTHALQEADETVKRTQYFNILTWAWNYLSRDRQERVIFAVDEAYLIVDPDTPQALQYMKNFSKRVRKYSAGLMVITHSIIDFNDAKVSFYGQALLNNPNFKFIMGSGEKDVEELMELYSLSEAERDLVSRGKRGEGLFIAGNQRIHAVIDIIDEEKVVFGSGGGN